MRAVLFEGTPEEFAKVEAMFLTGADPALQIRSIGLPQRRPKTWPELGEEHCYQLAKRVLERAPASLVEALAMLAEAQNLHGEQTIEEWASYANRLPEELCGTLAELGRGASRAFIELFGCDNAPERVKGAAYMLLERIPSDNGTCFAVRPSLFRAMVDLELLDALEEIEEASAPQPRPTAVAPRPSPPAAKAPRDAARHVPRRHPGAASSDAARPSGSPGGFLGDVARILSPLAGSARSSVAASPAAAGAEKPSPAPAVKPERNPFSLLYWADPDS